MFEDEVSRNILRAPAERGLGGVGGGFPWTDDNSPSFYVLPNYLNWWGFINFSFWSLKSSFSSVFWNISNAVQLNRRKKIFPRPFIPFLSPVKILLNLNAAKVNNERRHPLVCQSSVPKKESKSAFRHSCLC